MSGKYQKILDKMPVDARQDIEYMLELINRAKLELGE